ncbi:MAG: cytochrome c [Bacteroidota bacterium]
MRIRYLVRLLHLSILLLFCLMGLLAVQLVGTSEEALDNQCCGVVASNPLPNDPEAADEIAHGKKLFKNNCAQCHNRNMRDVLSGPALVGVEDRWSDYPREDLYSWIRNSQKMIYDQHPRALVLGKEWDFAVMNAFPDLSDEDIEALLAYINRKY